MATDGERGAEGRKKLLLRDPTGSNLSVNTEHGCLPMTIQDPLHPVCLCEL